MNGKILHYLDFMSGILQLIGFGPSMPLPPWKGLAVPEIPLPCHSGPADTDATTCSLGPNS